MRHETPRIDALFAASGTGFEDKGLPLAQQIVAGGEVTCAAGDIHRASERIVMLSATAELRAIAAVRAYARDSLTLGDAHWRSIRCVASPAPEENRAIVRVTLSGVAARSLCGDALAGAAAGLGVLADAMPGAVIGDLRVYAVDVEGRPRRLHPCALPRDVAEALPPERPALERVRCAVITLSDRASQGVYEDKSGARLIDLLQAQGGIVAHKAVLPDQSERLAAEVDVLARRGDIELLVCTGGTGIGPRDITPETLLGLGLRPVPGIGELLRSHSAHVVRSAWLSRTVAGTLGTLVVIALPGSQKAVSECMEALLPLLPHMISMLRGGGHD